jgi:hypothetical protein
MTKNRSVRSKRRQRNQKVRRELPGFQKFIEKRMEATRDTLERATGTVDETLATSLPEDLVAHLANSTTSAHLLTDETAAEVVRTRAQRVIVHNAGADEAVMLSDTLTPTPKPPKKSTVVTPFSHKNNVPLTHMSKSAKRAELRESKKPAKKKDLRV